MVEQTSTLNALLGVSDRNFRRPELIKKICVQGIIGRGGWVIDEDSVVFPVVGDDVTCMQCEVYVWNLEKKNKTLIPEPNIHFQAESFSN